MSVSLQVSHPWFFITALWLDRIWGSYRNIVTHTGEGTLQSSPLLYCCPEDSTITIHRCLKMPFGDVFMSCYHLLMSVGLLLHLLRGIRIKDPVIHGQSASWWLIISGLSGESQLNYPCFLYGASLLREWALLKKVQVFLVTCVIGEYCCHIEGLEVPPKLSLSTSSYFSSLKNKE